MKKILIPAVSVMLCAAALVFLPVRGEHGVYEDVIRLHVIAASDGEEDQAIKLAVRDSVLAALDGKIAGVTDREEAEAAIVASLSEVKKAAEKTVAENGSADAVSVTLSREKYPERDYGAFALPGGEYTSLRVTVGGGEGKNWWCIVFPSFCAASAERAKDDFTAAGFTDEQYGVLRKDAAPRYRIRFRILEILSVVFGFEY